LPDTLPDHIPEIPVGIPANMVNQRPDLVAARSRIDAADHEWSAAVKDLLPTITLSGKAGINS
jgi:outer membrane protein TolC